jgi:hypothetical protein
METFFLLSIVLAAIALPMRAARDPNPRRGFVRGLAAYGLAVAVYVFGLLYVLPRIRS